VFFENLSLPEADVNLEVGSGGHGEQTAEMVARLEHTFLEQRPDLVIVRGDTNSTLSGALAASKLHIPLAHIESGERSFNKRMPEEINRLVADRLADILVCITRAAVAHLADEGITYNVFYTGDVMLDALQQNLNIARKRSDMLARLDLSTDGYLLATVHRAGNTDDPDRLRGIVDAFNALGETVVFPIHPRTREAVDRLGLAFAPHVRAIEPIGYLDMLMLESHARAILTDSGGVQREAYFLSIPCVTLREETELMETVEVGWNRLVGTDPDRILSAVRAFVPPTSHPPLFGDGRAAEHIAQLLNAAPITFGQNYDRAVSYPAAQAVAA
jgi:UDP-N-acetylglucosamine 2-epimerase